MDQNGYLVNGAGYYLEGIPIDPKTGNPVGNAVAPLQFSNSFLPATATTTINYGANLPTYPKTALDNTAFPKSELLDPTDFSVDPTTRARAGGRQRRHDLPQRVARWRLDHGLQLLRPGGEHADALGEDRTPPSTAAPTPGSCSIRPIRPPPARRRPGKTPAPTSPSTRPAI